MSEPQSGRSRLGVLRDWVFWRRWNRRAFRELPWMLGVAATVVILCISHAGLWRADAWQTPADYAGDSFQTLGWIKAASEGEYHWLSMNFVSRLGAPAGANWNDYPMYERPFTILVGMVANRIGLMPATHVAILLTHLFAALSFQLVCRWFRWSLLWSAVGAVLFGLLYYNFWRSLPHLLLGLTYTVPMALLTVWLITRSRRLKRFSPTWTLVVSVALLMGVSNPYYLNIYVQLVLIALFIQWFGARRRENLQTGLIALGVASAGFLMVHASSLLFRMFAGANSDAFTRLYKEADLYGLRPIELLMPPENHRIETFANMGSGYRAAAMFVGEIFSPYLGVIGVALLCWMVMTSLKDMARGSGRRVSLGFWQTLWIISYSVVGGVNSWLAFGGLKLFRSSNRNSLFIAAIVLLWGVARLTRLSRTWPNSRQWLLALLVVLIGAVDQIPREKSGEVREQIRQRVNDDRKFAQQLESRLPPRAMVFELPVADFPEGYPILNMGPYDPLRLYFFTRTLRFSYGTNKGRMDGGWQHAVERLPLAQMIHRLESYGFQAAVIHRAGYVNDAKDVLQGLAALGYLETIASPSGDMLAVRLHPAAEPEYPSNLSFPVESYGQGWLRVDPSLEDTLWLQMGVAVMRLSSNLPVGQRARLTLRVEAPTPRRFGVQLNGKMILERNLKGEDPQTLEVEFTLPKGKRELVILTDKSASRFPNQPDLICTFAVRRLEVELLR